MCFFAAVANGNSPEAGAFIFVTFVIIVANFDRHKLNVFFFFQLLRMAIHQKLVLTQRLEDIEMTDLRPANVTIVTIIIITIIILNIIINVIITSSSTSS